jgi:hypothetical protein
MQRRMLAVATLATLSVAGPIAAAQGSAGTSRVTQGVVYGAVTSQGYPVVIKLSKTGRKVVRATVGIDLKCQVPPDITLPDDVKDIAVSAAGKFTATQAPERITTPADPATGTPAITLEVSAKLTGQVNRRRTQIKGTWQRKIVIFNPADPTGVAVLDTCDSGVLRFTATN